MSFTSYVSIKYLIQYFMVYIFNILIFTIHFIVFISNYSKFKQSNFKVLRTPNCNLILVEALTNIPTRPLVGQSANFYNFF